MTGDTAGELAAARHDVTVRIAAVISGSVPAEGGISFGKRVGEGTSAAIERFADVAVHTQLTQQLSAIDAAIERLQAGTYAICTRCGERIAAARLGAIPWAATCVQCA